MQKKLIYNKRLAIIMNVATETLKFLIALLLYLYIYRKTKLP